MLGETINIMTLGGLALAVGILVDDATVTIENIERHLSAGEKLHDGILNGASQIAVPAFVSSLCICIVFVPMFLLSGVAKYLFVPLAESVVFAVMASYVLSRTLVPTLAMYLLKDEHDNEGMRSPWRCEDPSETGNQQPGEPCRAMPAQGAPGRHQPEGLRDRPRPAPDGSRRRPQEEWHAIMEIRSSPRGPGRKRRSRKLGFLGRLAGEVRGRLRAHPRGLLRQAARSRAGRPAGFSRSFSSPSASAAWCWCRSWPRTSSPPSTQGQFKLHFRAKTGTRIEETAKLCRSDRAGDPAGHSRPSDLDGILDNIGLPYSGINTSYSNSGVIGSADGDVLRCS